MVYFGYIIDVDLYNYTNTMFQKLKHGKIDPNFQIDIDECENFADQFNINEMPTFVFFGDGTKLFSSSGVTEDSLEPTIQHYQ